MKGYSQNEIQKIFKERKKIPAGLNLQAQQVDIVSVIEDQGSVIVHDSEKWAHLSEHDSFVINKQQNSFHWNSRNISGNPINYLKDVKDYSYRNAIKELTLENDYKTKDLNVAEEREPFEFKPNMLANDTSKAKEYLVEQRGINEDLVDTLIDKKYIQQDHQGNAVFMWAKQGEIVGMDKQGTNPEKPFKQIEKNSDEKRGFAITNGEAENLYVFESSIDLLSYASMYNPKNARMVSMAGLKPQTYYNAIGDVTKETGKPPKNVVFALDSDQAGEAFMMEHMREELKHNESGITVKTHAASPRMQDFKQLGKPTSLNNWKDVKDFNDILTNIEHPDTKMNYQPVVIEKDEYFKKIDFDKKEERALEELEKEEGSNKNPSKHKIALKVAKFNYHTAEEEKGKTKSKNNDKEFMDFM